ncbi:MAG: Ig-like domain-containing protein [Verrucomicrobia subdivision 3 bacterium]|nr:Ig-like domain-containing protein [Limisphaerales bacterium]
MRVVSIGLIGLLSFGGATWCSAATANVRVGDNFFSPATTNINVNDTVTWTWIGFNSHSSTSSSGLWDSGIHGNGFTFSRQFTTAGNFPYFCRVHPFQTGSINVQAGNTPPTVTITSPTNNAIIHVPIHFEIRATASDPDGSVTQVEFFQGVTSLGVATTSPYRAQAEDANLTSGTQTFSAVATDNFGAKATNSITVIINSQPIIKLIRPDLLSFAEPATVTIEADVSDSDGTITQVEFRFTNTTVIATFTSPPYQFTVSNLVAGTHRGDVIATDDRNGQARSPFGIVVVTPVPVVLKAPQLLSPAQLRFSYSANAGLRYFVERSTNLETWTRINTNTADQSTVIFVDGDATHPINFYRVGRFPNP